eukprot:134972-Rhodomonas_salina.3
MRERRRVENHGGEDPAQRKAVHEDAEGPDHVTLSEQPPLHQLRTLRRGGCKGWKQFAPGIA